VWQRPPATLNGLPTDFLGRSLLGRVGYSQPIVRRLNWSLYGFAMLDVIDVDYTIAGAGLPGDSLRVLRGGGTANFKDDWDGGWAVTTLASTGLDVADAMANNRFSAGPSFLKANLSVDRLQPLGKSFSLMLRGTAQMSTGTVPAAEVFSFGGRDFGRAFNVAQSVSDRGIAVSAELRYALDWLGIAKDLAEPQAYIFTDRGWLSSVDPLNAPLISEGGSAGVGLRVRGWKKYVGEIELAKALDASPNIGGALPWRVSFRIGTNF
jgi:hemolysin activation/secretion protein